MAAKTPAYEVVKHEDSFELRRYESYLTASVHVTAADHAGAMSVGFDVLADYIFGNNHAADRISMTVPVTAGRACCEKIPMTAPVTSEGTEGEYVVSFTMPSGYSLADLPRPNNAAVSIEQVEAHLAAVSRFGGSLSESAQAEALQGLETWIRQQGLVTVGGPIVAQYDPPWKPGFARRNEIMIVVRQWVPIGPDNCDQVTGPFYHGTGSVLSPGDELLPGFGSNFQEGRVSNNIYFSALVDTAAWGAQLASALAGSPERGHIYIVEPLGVFEDDPNVTNKRFPGNPTQSYRTRAPLRVVKELEDWQGHSPEALKQMLDHLEHLREQGLDVIED